MQPHAVPVKTAGGKQVQPTGRTPATAAEPALKVNPAGQTIPPR